MAQGCSVPSAARALLRAQSFQNYLVTVRWLRHLTDLEFKHGNLEIDQCKIRNCQGNLPEFDDIFRFLFKVSLVHEMNTGKTQNYEAFQFCGSFTCLEKPWCTEWQFHNFLA